MYTPWPLLVSRLRCLLRGIDPNSVKHYLTDDNGKGYYKLAMTQIAKNENDWESESDESFNLYN